MILWEAAHGIYDIICSASDDNREMILSEIQSLSEREIEQRLHELVEDTSIINAMDISLEDRMQVARAIYQTLRQIVNQRPNPKEVIHIINQNLFRGDQVISIQNVHIASHSLGDVVVKTLLNGNQIQSRQGIHHLSYPKIDGFEIKGILGEGAYAKVYLV